MDAAVSYLIELGTDDCFAQIQLRVTGSTALLRLEDGNGRVRAQQEIPCTDFPMRQQTSYACWDGGTYGRACQYPFFRPPPEQWHLQWQAYRVEPSKDIVRRMLRHHLRTSDSPLKYITTDMIDMPDYGGVKYSLFAQNVAIAQWFRDTWDEMLRAQSFQVASGRFS